MNRNPLLSYIRRDITRFGECHLVNPIRDSGFDYGLLAIYDINGKKCLGLGDSINGPLNGAFLDITSLPEEDIEDIRREQIRQILSSRLADTDEISQMMLTREHRIGFTNGKDTCFADALFQVPGDGTIWIHWHHHLVLEDETGETNLDELNTDDQEKLLAAVIKQEEKAKDCAAVPEDLKKRLDPLWNAICDEHRHNVPYCDAMDIEKFDTFLSILSDEDTDPEEAKTLTKSLHFFAENDTLLPRSLKKAPLDTIRAYIKRHNKIVLAAIEKEIKEYEKEYLTSNE